MRRLLVLRHEHYIRHDGCIIGALSDPRTILKYDKVYEYVANLRFSFNS